MQAGPEHLQQHDEAEAEQELEKTVLLLLTMLLPLRLLLELFEAHVEETFEHRLLQVSLAVGLGA